MAALALWSWGAAVSDLFLAPPGEAPIAPSTALLIGLTSLAIFLRGRAPSAATRRFSCAVAGLTGLAGSLVCVCLQLGWRSLPEMWLRGMTDSVSGMPVGQMSSATGALFVLLAVAMAVESMTPPRRSGSWLACFFCSTAVLLTSVGVIVAYAFSIPWALGGSTITVAAWTAVALALTSTSLLICLLGDEGEAGGNSALGVPPPAPPPRFRGLMFAIFSVLSIGIGALGALYLRAEREEIQNDARNLLKAVGELKASQIVSWRQDCIADMRSQVETDFMARAITDFLARPDSSALGQRLAHWLDLARAGDRYQSVTLYDTAGMPLLTVPAEAGSSLPVEKEYIETLMASRKVVLTDLQRERDSPGIHLNMLLPVFTPLPNSGDETARTEPAQLAGLAVFRLDPHRFLYPLLQRWPTSSRTAETVLVRRDGNDVLYLNELRYRTNSALSFRLPLHASGDLPAAKAILGYVGQCQGFDYRGVSVVADVRPVPGSPWHVISKVDGPELNARLYEQAWMTLALTSALIVAVGLVAWVVSKHSQTLFARRELAAERERLALAHRVEHLMKCANDIILLTDEHGNILEANNRAVETYGYSEAELGRMNLADLSAPEAGVRGAPANAGTTRHTETLCETVHRRKDGSTLPVEKSSRYVEIADVRYGLCIVRDITERKQAERALRQSEHRFRALVENIPVGVVVQTEGKISYVNDCSIRLFKAESAAQLIGTPALDRVHPDFHERVRERIRVVNEERRAVPIEQLQWLRVDGSVIDAEVGAVPLRYEAKPGALVFFQDITERRRLEDQLRQAQKIEAIGQLAGGVAHDFNNILAATLMQLELMQMNPALGAEMRRDLEQLESHAKRAANLTRQLLLFGRRSVMQARQLDLNELVENLLKMLRRLIGENIELHWECQSNLPPVKVDAGMLDQVITNLVVNARDALPDGGRITLSTARVELTASQIPADVQSQPGVFVRLSVVDTGCGMDTATIERIFEPFFTTKEAGKGTGLGLATVYGIVKQHQGWVTVSSQFGKGTTFQVYFPAELQAKPDGSPDPGNEPIRGGTECILLVEDDAAIRQTARSLLSHWGYRVIEAANGPDAIALWEQHSGQIDLLFTDMVMPGGVSGIKLAENLRARRKNLAVILYSGYSSELLQTGTTIIEGLHFLPKPCSPQELSAAIRKCLDK